MSTTKKQSITTRTVKETPKAELSREVREKLTVAWKGVERIANMMHGLDTLCMNTDESGPLHDFSFAIAYLAEMAESDARAIADKICTITEGGAE
jgi:hypothetical protein